MEKKIWRPIRNVKSTPIMHRDWEENEKKK